MTRLNEIFTDEELIAAAMTAPRHDNELVREFQLRFQIPMPERPLTLMQREFIFRLDFMQEELNELREAYLADDLVKQADALCDLAYVLHGTALMMGLPWAELFGAVHAANMRKITAREAGVTGRHPLDVVKPSGWTGPESELRRILLAAGWSAP